MAFTISSPSLQRKSDFISAPTTRCTHSRSDIESRAHQNPQCCASGAIRECGEVCYARSCNFSTMWVWTTGTTNAVFDIPKSCEKGAITLQVVVTGLAPVGASVTLDGSRHFTNA